jgi:protoporphyrinogen oxidase
MTGHASWQFHHLVVTFPIHEAVRCFDDIPPHVIAAVNGLRYNSLRLAFVAVDNASLLDKSAIYLPDPEVLPHRVCFMGYFSPNMVRPGASSLVAETTARSGDPIDRMSNDEFLEAVIDDLDRVGILRRHDVILRETRRFEYAYPVYDHAHGTNTRIIREYFAERGIDLLGRFAEFDYINSDEVMRRAIALAQRLNEQSVCAPDPTESLVAATA